MTKKWGTRPLFVSVTFRDMQAERVYLRDVVFPELAEKLCARRYHLEPIDLCWGVETGVLRDKETREKHVLKVCFDDIEKSMPFLVVFLGDRYGWKPSEYRGNTEIGASD